MTGGTAEGLVVVEVGSRRSWAGRSGRGPRLVTVAVALALVLWAVWGTGVGRRPLLNPAGWPQVRDFLAAATAPELAPEFLALVGQAALVTVAYAVLGTVAALAFGLVGGLLASATVWRGGRRPGRVGWLAARGALALPRGLHEAVWALLLVNVLGLDPLVAVLAIGIPYGAITAKVYADLLDEAPRAPYEALRAAGAGRGGALLYGLLPLAAPDLVSYACYRFECSVRSAVVLGVIGAGGLGFQLELSFSALRYAEMWTVIAALAALCATAELGGAALRARLGRAVPSPVPPPAAADLGLKTTRPRPRMRPVSPRLSGDVALRTRPPWVRLRRDRVLPVAGVAGVAAVAWAVAYLDVDLGTLVAERTRTQLRLVAGFAWPPALGRNDLLELVGLALATLQMSVLAVALAAVGGLALSVLAARTSGAGAVRRVTGAAVRALLLLARAVPPPVWAFGVLFVLRPGLLPGAVALAAYNLGVLGRLMAEAQEGLPATPVRALRTLGAARPAAWLYGVLPRVLPRDLAYALYRWEVATRETVIVGLVGAGGLGVLLARQNAAFDWPGMLTTLGALVLLTLVVDLLSAAARRVCR